MTCAASTALLVMPASGNVLSLQASLATNGSFLNGTPMGPGQWPLRVRDLMQFGDVALLVEGIDHPNHAPTANPVDEGAIQKLLQAPVSYQHLTLPTILPV